MKITKYEHACVVIEDQGSTLVIDPGVYAKSLPELNNVSGIVITHVHHDHYDKDLVKKVLAANPDLTIYSVKEVIDDLSDLKVKKIVAQSNKSESNGVFKLEFFGERHALIYGNQPKADNVGVKVNDKFYYPGDSFNLPSGEIVVLALPANAPWMKNSEAMDFLIKAKPRQVFPTHDYFLSTAGKSLNDNLVGGLAKQTGIEYHSLEIGHSISI